jgi:hypothetical protein
MRRAILILFLVLVPVAARAQVQGDLVIDDERGATDRLDPLVHQTIAAAHADASSVAPQARPVPPPDNTIRRRRGSMVGYIDDGQIRSQVLFRFDAAFRNGLPDRAEFFYAKCGCYQGLAQAIPQAFDPSAPGPGPAVPTSLNFQQLYVDAEYAPNSHFSFFAEIPARWIQPQSFKPIPPFAPFSSQGGLGDIRAGVKLAIVSSSDSSLTAQLRGYFPSGSASKGLGTNHGSVEAALLYYYQVSDRLVLESQVGDWHPTGGSAGVPVTSSDKFSGDVFFYGIGPSYEVYRRGTIRFAPVIELVGWSVRGGFLTQPGGPVLGAAANASGTNIVNLKIGARASWNPQSSFYGGYGHALTSASWYEDIVRFEYRYSF